MSDKLKIEFKQETGCHEIFPEIDIFRINYIAWLESQLEQARADKAELLQVMQKIYDEGCSVMIEPFELVEPLLKKHGE